jgi:hypothetical protein
MPMRTHPEIKIGTTFKAYDHKGNYELWLVTGFQMWDSGKTGIESVRWIKSRNDWAKCPKSWLAIEQYEAQENMQASKIEFINEGE